MKQRGIDDLPILFIDSMHQNVAGRVELVEFQRPARERLLQIDANSDGFIPPGERKVNRTRIPSFQGTV